MDIKEISSNSLSYIGDAVYTLKVREFFIEHRHQASKDLQKLCNRYNCARGQAAAYERLAEEGFFTEEEKKIFKRERNHITHIPKNGDRKSYETASGLEAIVGYLYLCDRERMEELFREVFKGGEENE